MITPEQNLMLQALKKAQHFNIFVTPVEIIAAANEQMVFIVLVKASPVQRFPQKGVVAVDIGNNKQFLLFILTTP